MKKDTSQKTLVKSSRKKTGRKRAPPQKLEEPEVNSFRGWHDFVDKPGKDDAISIKFWERGLTLVQTPKDCCLVFFNCPPTADSSKVLKKLGTLEAPPEKWLEAAHMVLVGELSKVIVSKLPREKWETFAEREDTEGKNHLLNLLNPDKRKKSFIGFLHQPE